MQASIALILTAVTAALAAPKPFPQASCSIEKVNQCVSQVRSCLLNTCHAMFAFLTDAHSQCGGGAYDCFDDTCFCP